MSKCCALSDGTILIPVASTIVKVTMGFQFIVLKIEMVAMGTTGKICDGPISQNDQYKKYYGSTNFHTCFTKCKVHPPFGLKPLHYKDFPLVQTMLARLVLKAAKDEKKQLWQSDLLFRVHPGKPCEIE